MNKKIKHPLVDEDDSLRIKELEENFTIEEMISWLRITIYVIPEGTDDEFINELNSYKQILNDMLGKSLSLKRVKVTEAYKLLNIEMEY